MDEVIRIDGLRKTFKDVVAVDGLDFKVKRGELFAFLGVNGAGKSTTISIMCGQLKKDAGKVLINGLDIDKDFDGVKREIGVVYQNSVLDKVLTVEDNLRDRAALYGIVGAAFEKRLKELSEKLEFSDLLNRTVGKLSGGQRRRIDVARALLHEPNILILDEPTTGLDPQTRKRLWSVITELRKTQGMTVFLTTHYMEEAAEADYVVILDAGKIVAEGTPLQLKNAYTGDFILLYGATIAQAQELGLPYEAVVGGYKVAVENTAVATQLIVQNPHIFTDYEVIKGKMDDVFLSATGKKLGATGGENK